MYRRYITEEEDFLIHENGFKFVLKEKPDLESLTVICRRDRTKKRSGAIAGIIIGILLIVLFFIGILVMYFAFASLCEIDKNNECKYELFYYNPEKKTIIFCSSDKGYWYEVEAKKVRGFDSVESKDILRIVIETGDDEQDTNDIKVGYATTEEKKACLERINRIKDGTYYY